MLNRSKQSAISSNHKYDAMQLHSIFTDTLILFFIVWYSLSQWTELFSLFYNARWGCSCNAASMLIDNQRWLELEDLSSSPLFSSVYLLSWRQLLSSKRSTVSLCAPNVGISIQLNWMDQCYRRRPFLAGDVPQTKNSWAQLRLAQEFVLFLYL